MTLAIAYRTRSVLLSAILMAPFMANGQTTLTGAVEFQTNSDGSIAGDVWNTQNGSPGPFKLWFASNRNFSSPVNGPGESQASISVPLQPGNTYTFYLCGQPGASMSIAGINLFFDGNTTNPSISVYGNLNSALFLPNASTSTYGFGNSVVPGSGRNFYISNGITTVLNDYEFVQPQYDICQGDAFSPGGGNDFLGFITLSAGETASLNVSNGGGPPEAKVVISGQGFAPGETVDIYSDRIGGVLLTSGPAGQAGGFAFSTRLPQRPYGSMELIAVGQTTGNIGLASLSIKAGMAADPNYGMPGETTTADALGFAAAESVAIYWNSPRQLLTTVTTDKLGSAAVEITIPRNATLGTNAIIGVGQTSGQVGVGEVTVD